MAYTSFAVPADTIAMAGNPLSTPTQTVADFVQSLLTAVADQQHSAQRVSGNCRHRGDAKKRDVRINNINAAKAVADAVRTSLGPRGMDKMVRRINHLP